MTSSKKPAISQAPAPAGAKPSIYGRFIPREELDSFAAWSPDVLSGAPTPDDLGVHAPVPEPPPKPTPAELLSAKLHETRQQGYQEGYRDGLAALEMFKQSYANQITAQLTSITQSLLSQMDDLQQDMARVLAVSATNLARQVVRSELQIRPDLVVDVANEALEALLLSARHITVRVHPSDLALVADGAAEFLAARGGRVLGDASVTPGGCLVESDIGVIDASIETRWRRAAAAMGCEDTWDADVVSSGIEPADELDHDNLLDDALGEPAQTPQDLGEEDHR